MKNNSKYRVLFDCVITAKDKEGNLHKIDINRDEFPLNPRKDWDNVDHMIVDWNHYDLGDQKEGSVSDELTRLVREYCYPSEVVDAVLGEEPKLETIRLIKDDDPGAEEDDYVLQTGCAWRTAPNRRGPVHWEDAYFVKKKDAFDYIIDLLADAHCVELLKPHMEIFPLSIYEHSGITMRIGAPMDDFDSGYAGFIYITKKEALDNFGGATEENWREKSREYMSNDVEIYDNYLQGDVYGYEVHKLVDVPAEIHHETIVNAETGETIGDREWSTDPRTEEVLEEEWCGSFFGYDHEENGLLDELPADWEIVEVK